MKKLTDLKAEIDGVLKSSSTSPDQIAEKISEEFFNAPKSEIEDLPVNLESAAPPAVLESSKKGVAQA